MDNIPYLVHLKNLFDVDENTTMELGGSDLTGMGDDGLHHAVYGADLTFRNVPLRQSNQRGWILQGEYLEKVSYNGSVYNHGDRTAGTPPSNTAWDRNGGAGFRVEEAFNSVSGYRGQSHGHLSFGPCPKGLGEHRLASFGIFGDEAGIRAGPKP